MTTIFERARTVIETLIPVAGRLIKDGTPVHMMVRRRLASLSQAYGGRLLNENRQAIDYTKTTTHIAYTYRCLGAHGDWVYRSLRLAPRAVLRAFANGPVKIAAIGGGPGSDIAGVLKFAAEHELQDDDFEFVVLDRESAWTPCRGALLATYQGDYSVSEKYQSLDLGAGQP